MNRPIHPPPADEEARGLLLLMVLQLACEDENHRKLIEGARDRLRDIAFNRHVLEFRGPNPSPTQITDAEKAAVLAERLLRSAAEARGRADLAESAKMFG